MWVVFLLSAMSVAVCFLLIAYIANVVFIAMRKDEDKYMNENRKDENHEG